MNKYYSGPPSDHFDGERFFNPGLGSTDKSILQLLRWRLLGKRARWPKQAGAPAPIKPATEVEGLRITLIGHSSLLVQTEHFNALVDPVWAERASPLSWAGPKRVNAPAVAMADLPPLHAILLTHNHYDHMDLSTIEALWHAHHPLVVAPLGNDTVLKAAIPEVDIVTRDWWEAVDLPQGGKATVVPAYHWSSRSLGDRRMALWGGFVLETTAGAVYLAGDSAYGDGAIFQEIGRRFGPPRVAVLPIGAYAPRWFMAAQHMDPKEALQAAEDCRAQEVLGVHWGTFQLTDEPYQEPAELLDREPSTVPKRAMKVGEVWDAGVR